MNPTRPAVAAPLRMLAAVFASALMAALYVRGGAAWVLGFVFLVPWLRTLDDSATWPGALLRATLMAMAYSVAAFAWFGQALGDYTGIGAAAGVALLLLGAALFQPQFLVFALVRHVVRRRHGALAGALAGAAAWVATEWLLPKVLGDTLGHGLYPARLLRQAADIGGAAGLTLCLLLANEAAAHALARRGHGWRVAARALLPALALPLVLAGYGMAVLTGLPASAGKPLRVGLIQSNIIGYEQQRQEKGAHAVVREVLDTHFAMSYDAVVRQRADAVLWSETAYPTTFGQPRSDAGAEFDRQIIDIVNAAGVPFIFGTYERDGAGEYNAAAFLQPHTGLLGFYRKTRLFPLTEFVPAWLDGPMLRAALPWTGAWLAGNGARVFPLRLADGREIAVLPLICLDDVDTRLAIDGARLGAQAILTMSNDSWFTTAALGAELHQSLAAFRSIETRLPQFRVTTNGYSAVIDASGTVLAGSRMGERTLVIGDVAVRSPAPTLMVLWGDWVGRAACAALLLLAAWSLLPAWRARRRARAPRPPPQLPMQLAVLAPAARLAAVALRLAARAGLLWLGLALLLDPALRTNTLTQLRMFGALFLAPEAAAWCIMYVYAARASIAPGMLVLERGATRVELALADITAVSLWRLPLPCGGLSLAMAGRRHEALACDDPAGLAALLAQAGAPAAKLRVAPGTTLHAYLQAARTLRTSRLDHPLAKYVLLPLALALPAFHLHQHIAFGGALGEYHTFGLKAYLGAFALWWGAWSIGVILCGAALRTIIEAGTLLAALLRPGQAIDIRHGLQGWSHVALFLGMPVWLFVTIYGA